MKDLAEVSLELLMNSLEAHASRIEIELSLDETNHILIQDNGDGIPEERLNTITSPFSTSRSTRTLGFGLAFFKQAIEQADGRIEIQSKLHEGTRIQGWWKASHMDALPLGNIGETLALVLQRSPQCELTFTLIQNQKTNTFNSVEIQALITPLTLDEPEIQRWIENSINSLFVN